MNLKPNDPLRWEGGNGILREGQVYLVWKVQQGARGDEFTLKYPDWQMVEPIVWWEAGEPFTPITELPEIAA